MKTVIVIPYTKRHIGTSVFRNRISKSVPSRLSYTAILLIIAIGLADVSAQTINIAAGYTSMPGRFGDRESDTGMAARLGIDILSRQRIYWSMEAEVNRLNEVHRIGSVHQCATPGGGSVQCQSESYGRDSGWSLSSLLRFRPISTTPRLYALVGLGIMTESTRSNSTTVDDAGNVLPNFGGDYSRKEGALLAHFGLGFDIPADAISLPFGVYFEARESAMMYTYSGGYSGSWNLTAVLGARARL